MKNILLQIFGLTLIFLGACSHNEELAPEEGVSPRLVEFDISITRDDTSIPKEDPNIYFKNGESCVLISQAVGTSDNNIDFSENSDNCYKYVYNGNPDANWDEGFNFESVNPISWDKVYLNGQSGNGFAFAALFFPRDYKEVYEIPYDQRDQNVFIESDVLGAWHRTSSYGDRLRFRMYHLMCLIKINLYVPVFDEEKGNGIDPDYVTATAINFNTSYSVLYGDRTTDLALILNATGEISNDIYMYQTEEPSIIEDFETDAFETPGLDKVRKYSFQALFPYQTKTGDLFRFTLGRGDMSYNYLFKNSGESSSSNNIMFEQGHINYLELYLPRADNEIVLLRATLKDWNSANATFTITEETDNNS